MTRYNTCSGCGLRFCDGRCFNQSAADYHAETEETAAPQAPYVPSEEYLAWRAEVDAQLTVCQPDPLRRVG